MTKRSELIGELFHRALDLPAKERDIFLRERCAGQDDLRSELERLLEADGEVDGCFLERSTSSFDRAFLGAGTTLGRYTIIDRLGEGGMGTVYAARQESPAREVALKVIRSDRLSSDLLRRFHHEAEILGSLQHPGIAQVYESGTAEARTPDGARFQEPYLAMEFVHGVPLREFVRSRGLDVRARLALLARICDAVQHAHLRGVIHRDLKPGNVLVVDDGTDSGTDEQGLLGVGQPKILDFGIARVIGSAGEASTRQTKAGDLLGTLAYMSPEQVAGPSADVDVRSDVYALGVMLYELLANRLPLDLAGASVPEAVRRITDETAPTLGSIDPALRGDISVIASKALEKEKERRYQSAADLAADARRALRGEPIEARADSALYLLRRKLRRHRALLATGTVALALTTGFAMMFATQARENRLLAASEVQANREKDAALKEASAGFLRALGATNEMLRRVGQSDLEGIPRATQLRRDLLEESALLYTSLLEEHPDDPLLRREAAAGYRWQGRLRAELGELELAGEALGEAVDLLAELNQEMPGDLDILAELSVSTNDYGKLLSERGNEREALEMHRRSARVYTELAAALGAAGMHSSNLWGTRLYLATSLSNSGTSLTRTRQYAEGEEILVEARGQLTSLVREQPASIEGRYHLAACCTALSGVAFFAGNNELAREAAEAAISVCGGLIDESPSIPRNRVLASRAWFNLSIAHSRSGRAGDEEEAILQCVLLIDELAEEYPDVIAHQVDRIRSLAQLGSIICGPGRYAEALEMLEEAAPLADELRERYPSHPPVLEIRVRALMELGQHRNCAGEFAAAEEPLRLALAGANELLERWPDYNPTGRNGAASASELGVALQGLGRLTEARAFAEESVTRTHVGASKERELWLSNRLVLLAGIAADQGDHERVAEACAQVLELRTSARNFRRAAGALGTCAAQLTGDASRADTYADDALALLERAFEAGFDDTDEVRAADDLAPLRQRSGFRELLLPFEGRD